MTHKSLLVSKPFVTMKAFKRSYLQMLSEDMTFNVMSRATRFITRFANEKSMTETIMQTHLPFLKYVGFSIPWQLRKS